MLSGASVVHDFAVASLPRFAKCKVDDFFSTQLLVRQTDFAEACHNGRLLK